MIWKEKPRPRDYEFRERVEFAWLPRKVDAGLVVWLERVRIREVYSPAGFSTPASWDVQNTWPERYTAGIKARFAARRSPPRDPRPVELHRPRPSPP